MEKVNYMSYVVIKLSLLEDSDYKPGARRIIRESQFDAVFGDAERAETLYMALAEALAAQAARYREERQREYDETRKADEATGGNTVRDAGVGDGQGQSDDQAAPEQVSRR